MRLTLRTLTDDQPNALIAEIDAHGGLWQVLALVAYNATYGYDETARRELLSVTYIEGTGTYPFGEHILLFGRIEQDGPVVDAPVWLGLVL